MEKNIELLKSAWKHAQQTGIYSKSLKEHIDQELRKPAINRADHVSWVQLKDGNYKIELNSLYTHESLLNHFKDDYQI